MSLRQAIGLSWLGGLCLLPLPAAQAQGDALQWMQRASQAAQKLNYTGTFVYRSGGIAETSRITHLVDAAGEAERIEVLDGSPREVVRINDEVKCYLPEARMIIVEQRPTRRAFPGLLPVSFGGGIGENYVVKKGNTGRVAGLDTQSIMIEPRDDLRYGHRWWVDSQSGMLVKANLIGESGEALETFVFTELRIGGPINRESVRAGSHINTSGWKVQQPKATDNRADEDTWNFRTALPGFRKVSAMKRQARADAPAGSHWVFSDGLAAISVFIDPMPESPAETGLFKMGAVNVYKRQLGEFLVVVMGDVPHVALKRLGDGIEARRK
ncbi:MAG: MucB/RseB C-terminal domain-containing protein [Gammaproteobacteria bacterium]|nr:MucB/RseB C-terminal domain-containing protein [Gammaproteobacteria bacterium]MBU1646593.1 MucB/RseB C-terminal domain-containing protein [Gammaproteobacteria bacterium]MBU1972850.1 MucB/RseB C-terminal domain-containing protein [Gammaproteobacteria bacterium]